MEIILLIKSILGVVYCFFLPGFLLSLYVFKKNELDFLERIGISVGLSVLTIIPVLSLFYPILLPIGIKVSEINVFLSITFLNILFSLLLTYKIFFKRIK